ncbi:hypothetical protein K0028_05100 [Curtobacterium flaccumfaciens pv. flaccumfaciens]|uniref:hypothetical protein n=1 Tax=Curtobacterium flaccumfaciens TaxID=2035 RepID=UPI0021B0F39B|nr:hypothetical protein [Curtobacterium flaccumfaciens]QYI98298.1 hypothetical protein K0028_05100 [Curtobacterium flaccumfaciens pv. flaccumfaciens]
MGTGPWAADRRRLALVGVLVGVVVVGSVSLWTISHTSDDGDTVTRADSLAPEPARSPDNGLQPTNALEEPIEPEPVRPVDGSPIDPWWRRVPPVSGDIVGIGAAASGHVRIAGNTGDETLAVEIDHLETGGDGPVDVVLSAGTVRGGSKPVWTPAGESYDLFQAAGVEQGLTVVLSDPWSLPDEVRSLVLLDADTGTVLGGAALVPSD